MLDFGGDPSRLLVTTVLRNRWVDIVQFAGYKMRVEGFV